MSPKSRQVIISNLTEEELLKEGELTIGTQVKPLGEKERFELRRMLFHDTYDDRWFEMVSGELKVENVFVGMEQLPDEDEATYVGPEVKEETLKIWKLFHDFWAAKYNELTGGDFDKDHKVWKEQGDRLSLGS